MRGLTAVALIIGALVIGVGGYELGVAQNIAGQVPAGTTPYLYPHFWGFGLPFFAFLFPLLGFFLVFALIRAVVWGGHHGYGYRYRPWRYHDPEDMLEEWHREAHGEKPAAPGGSSEAGPRR